MTKTCRQKAEEHYDINGENFHYTVEMLHEMDNGWVIDVPYCFGMGYFYLDGEDVVLYVTYVTGDFPSLLRYCLNIVIDKIEFMRNFNGRVRRYDFDKFIERVG